MNLEELSNKISDNLSIDRNIILNLLKEKKIDLTTIIPNDKMELLLKKDLEIKNFGNSLISDNSKTLFSDLKKELGKLQISNLLKHLNLDVIIKTIENIC